MKVLVVSFDKNLVKGIKEALKEYDVIDVKNGEEAINTVSSADVIIYDAISGSISEEDINKMYQSKFKDAKYIVLVDDLFPVDMNNIIAKKKVKLPREEAVSKIKEALSEDYTQEVKTDFGIPELEIEMPSFGQYKQQQQEEYAFHASDLEIEMPSFEQYKESATSKKKVLIVSFDSTLTDSIKTALGTDFEIINVKNAKDAKEKAREADIIVFDTISGMIAQKTLMEMSQEKELAQKPYVLLLDDLFTIDVDKINLPNKHSFSREAEIAKAVEKIRELAKEETKAHEVSGEIMSFLDELFKEQKSEEPMLESFPLEFPSESGKELLLEPPPEKTPEIPSQLPLQAEKEMVLEPFAEKTSVPQIKVEKADMENVLKEQLKELLSEKLIENALISAVREMSINSLIEKVIKEEVEKQLSAINLVEIIREETSKALRERLRELIT